MNDEYALDVLRAARELLADPDHWTKEASARDAAGARTDLYGSDAIRWCVAGATIRAADVYGRDLGRPLADLRNTLEKHFLRQGLSVWNDAPETTHDDVLRLFDLAIAGLTSTSSELSP